MGRALPRIPREAPVWNRKPNDRVRKDHTDWIKTLPCIKCGRGPCDPAHVRIGNTGGGAGLKPPDRYTVPLCKSLPQTGYEGCHAVQHKGEVSFWAELGVDPVDIALRLWAVSGDTEQALRTIARAQQTIELKRRAPDRACPDTDTGDDNGV